MGQVEIPCSDVGRMRRDSPLSLGSDKKPLIPTSPAGLRGRQRPQAGGHHARHGRCPRGTRPHIAISIQSAVTCRADALRHARLRLRIAPGRPAIWAGSRPATRTSPGGSTCSTATTAPTTRARCRRPTPSRSTTACSGSPARQGDSTGTCGPQGRPGSGRQVPNPCCPVATSSETFMDVFWRSPRPASMPAPTAHGARPRGRPARPLVIVDVHGWCSHSGVHPLRSGPRTRTPSAVHRATWLGGGSGPAAVGREVRPGAAATRWRLANVLPVRRCCRPPRAGSTR